MRRSSPFIIRLGLPLALALASLALNPFAARVVAAEENNAAATAQKNNTEKTETKTDAKDAAAPNAAHRVPGIDGQFMTALALWSLIVVAGLALLTMTIVWGRSLRSAIRRKPSASTAPDPLWYLKTKPPLPPTPAATDAASGPPSRPRPDDTDPGSEP
jgi:hypothetical protein